MTKLNPTHLQTFAVVAETGNLTRAGLQLDLGQSAISSQLRLLQTAIGAPLYRRSGHGITLTSAGEALLPFAQEIARQVGLAQYLIEERQLSGPKQVRLGLCLTLGETLPPLILRKCSSYPDIHLDIVVAPTRELGHAVEQGELLIAFAGGSAVPSPSAAHPLQVCHAATDRLAWVAPGGRGDGKTTLREAATFPWLWAHTQSTVKTLVEDAARAQGVELPASFVLGSYAAVRHGILSGLGGAFLPYHHLRGLAPENNLTGQAIADTDLRMGYQSLTCAAHESEDMRRVKHMTLSVLDDLLNASAGPVGETSDLKHSSQLLPE